MLASSSHPLVAMSVRCCDVIFLMYEVLRPACGSSLGSVWKINVFIIKGIYLDGPRKILKKTLQKVL
jgi:hypothetical protein